MKKRIAILGSTGSIGKCLLNIIDKDIENFNIVLLTAHKNFKVLFNQAKKFNVKNLIISDLKTYNYVKKKIKSNKFKIYNNFDIFDEIFKDKIDYTMNSIVGLSGLNPTIKIIKHTKTIAIANKESIICAWNLIIKEFKKYNTSFIPVDSEHFSIWSSIGDKSSRIDKIYLTASGGPFYKLKFKQLNNVSINQALNHPTWKMGKKISIDSATMMNKVFELIEAKKIFGISYTNLKILIHPKSYVHSIIKFKNGLINIVAHETSMKIPIFNSIYFNTNRDLNNKSIDLFKLNYLNLFKVNNLNFPLVKIANKMPDRDSLFETVIVSANDYLVNLFLNKKIKYIDIIKILLKISKMRIFIKFKKISPHNVSSILETKNYTVKTIDKLFALRK